MFRAGSPRGRRARRRDGRGHRLHYGRDEVLRGLLYPFWFQSLGVVLECIGIRRGITTSVLCAIKSGLAPIEWESAFMSVAAAAAIQQTPASCGRSATRGLDWVSLPARVGR